MIKRIERTSKLRTSRLCCLLLGCIMLLLAPSFQTSAHVASDPLQGCPPVEEEIVDLEILADMLAKTSAVGLLTKLSLKKDINKVLSRLEDFHNGRGRFALVQLEEQYNLLLMKIATYLQDKDLATHRHLCNAWLVIWEDLKDPERFRSQGP